MTVGRRRILGAGALLGALPHAARLQPASRRPVIGFLTSGGAESLAQFREALRDIGYVEGRDFEIDVKSSAGKPEDLPALARTLVARPADVIYATGPPAVRAASQAAASIPVVAFDLESDPVKAGLVRTLARPGGNLTGLFLDLPGIAGKWLELLASVEPARRSVALVWDDTTGTAQVDAARAAARALRIEVRAFEYRSAADIDKVLEAAIGSGSAIAFLSSPIVSSQSARLAEITIARRVAAISPFRSFAESGGLMSYGPNLREFRRYSADYVDRILKGAKPAELPIQQPTTFELVVNLRTARAIGLVVPQSVLLRADHVIS